MMSKQRVEVQTYFVEVKTEAGITTLDGVTGYRLEDGFYFFFQDNLNDMNQPPTIDAFKVDIIRQLRIGTDKVVMGYR